MCMEIMVVKVLWLNILLCVCVCVWFGLLKNHYSLMINHKNHKNSLSTRKDPQKISNQAQKEDFIICLFVVVTATVEPWME